MGKWHMMFVLSFSFHSYLLISTFHTSLLLLTSSKTAMDDCLSLSFIGVCILTDNRMNPLNRVSSLADVQAVTVHFIIIGSSHLRERESMEGGLDRQAGEMTRRQETENSGEGRMDGQRRGSEREDRKRAHTHKHRHTQREESLQPTFKPGWPGV